MCFQYPIPGLSPNNSGFLVITVIELKTVIGELMRVNTHLNLPSERCKSNFRVPIQPTSSRYVLSRLYR